MATKKLKGLGRGLDALLGGGDFASPEQAAPTTLAVTQMQAGKYQPRTRMDEGALNELAASIKAQGLMQPILVRPIGQDTLSGLVKYEIIAGERRFRASQLAGLTEVPVLVRDVDDLAAAAMALIENIQREDLNPLEEAQSLQRLIGECSLTPAEAAEAVGRSRAAVSNLLRLLELPPAIRALLEARRLEMGHARALLTLSPELASKLASDAADQGWSVREVEHRAQQFAAGKLPVNGSKKAKPGKATPQADIASLETELSESLGTKVSIAHGRGGKGKLVIHYTSVDTLDGVLERLRSRAV